jgi:hypothetical protein
VKPIALSILTVLFAVSACSQSSPDLRFNGHVLGETVETFFSTATMFDSKTMTKEYCKALLNNTEAMKSFEDSRIGVNKKAFLLSDVGGCQQVMAALRGERAPVGARFASELGKGRVVFVAGKLVSFMLTTNSPYTDVTADMTKRFGVSGHKYTRTHGSGLAIEGMRWDVGGVIADVFKLPYHDEGVIDVHYAEQSE